MLFPVGFYNAKGLVHLWEFSLFGMGEENRESERGLELRKRGAQKATRDVEGMGGRAKKREEGKEPKRERSGEYQGEYRRNREKNIAKMKGSKRAKARQNEEKRTSLV